MAIPMSTSFFPLLFFHLYRLLYFKHTYTHIQCTRKRIYTYKMHTNINSDNVYTTLDICKYIFSYVCTLQVVGRYLYYYTNLVHTRIFFFSMSSSYLCILVLCISSSVERCYFTIFPRKKKQLTCQLFYLNSSQIMYTCNI